MKKRYFKTLNADNRSYYECPDAVWSLPVQDPAGKWVPGEWMPEVNGKLRPYIPGYCLTSSSSLIDCMNCESIYEAEPSREMIKESNNGIFCRSVRLLRKMNWDKHVARLFACTCAEHVLSIYERDYPNDNRLRSDIHTARLYANGKVGIGELNAAHTEAYSIAKDLEKPGVKEAAWAVVDATTEVAFVVNVADSARLAVEEDIVGGAKDIEWDIVKDKRGVIVNTVLSKHGEMVFAAMNKEYRWQNKQLMRYLDENA